MDVVKFSRVLLSQISVIVKILSCVNERSDLFVYRLSESKD